jgi:bifunctional non-homologous end joining protein LigD
LDLPKVGSKSAASKKKSRSGSKKFKISHPDKILIAGLNVTKQDIAEYYDDIQKWILPHVKDRPLALVRCPDGIGKECFFQKSLHDMKPSGVFEEHVKGQKGKTENVIYMERAEGLTGLTQIGVLEIHTWQTHRQNLMKPDQLIFDLDPGSGVKWSSVAAAAFELKDLLSQLKLKSFVKTSGGKGLHVHVPIAPREDWDTVKAFAKAMAQLMSEKEPNRYLSVMSKSKRAGHIFIDYLRNGYGATAIAPYGLRARPEAGIALPLEWEEIEDIRPDQFTIENAVKYIQKRASDPWKGYFTTKQRLRLDDLEDVES